MTPRNKILVHHKSRVNLATPARTRYRDAAMNWIALGVLLSAWHMEARLDRRDPLPPNAIARSSDAREAEPLWWSESRARAWTHHAAAAATATIVPHVVPPAPAHTPLATVRTIRRWLTRL